MKEVRLTWQCTGCKDIKVSSSYEPYKIDGCYCEATRVKLTQTLMSSVGEPKIIEGGTIKTTT